MLHAADDIEALTHEHVHLSARRGRSGDCGPTWRQTALLHACFVGNPRSLRHRAPVPDVLRLLPPAQLMRGSVSS